MTTNPTHADHLRAVTRTTRAAARADAKRQEALTAALRAGVPIADLTGPAQRTAQHLRRIARDLGLPPEPAGRPRTTPTTDSEATR